MGAREMVGELNERINILMAENAVMADQVMLLLLFPMSSSPEVLHQALSPQEGMLLQPSHAFLRAAIVWLIVSAIQVLKMIPK